MHKDIYLDNAATTFPKPPEVYDYMMNMYKNYGFNLGRGVNYNEINLNGIATEVRQMLKKLVKANYDYEVIFQPSATIAINQVLRGLDFSNIKNVYISYFEHNAVLRTLESLKKDYSMNIRYLEFDINKWEYDYSKIKYDFENNTPDLVIVSHVSNVIGYISPIDTIGEIAKQYNDNAIYMVDGSQSVGIEDINIIKSKIDFLIYAGHKTLYAPYGIAGFIMNKFLNLEPLIYGGTGTESANLEMPNTIPTKYEAGSMNILSIFGLYQSLKWIEKIGTENIRKKEDELTYKLVKIMNKYDYIQLYLPNNNHRSIVSFKIKGYPVDSMGELIAKKYNIALRYGLHCSPLVHKLINSFPEGTIRFSLSYFTEEEDLQALEEIFDDLEYEI